MIINESISLSFITPLDLTIIRQVIEPTLGIRDNISRQGIGLRALSETLPSMKNEARIDEENEKKNHFQRLPDDMKYRILARLDTKCICHARAVCQNWNGLLSPSSLQALQTSTESSSAFLVRIGYIAGATEHARFVTVDHGLNLGTVDMPGGLFLRRILTREWSLDVSPDGFIASFPPGIGKGSSISVCHLSFRWMRVIRSFPGEAPLKWFRGSCYDPSTSQFTLLVGFLRGQSVFIYLYNSETWQWKRIVNERGDCFGENDQVIDNAVYFQGKFFWIVETCASREDSAVVWFDLLDEKMHRMPLPDIPRLGSHCYNLSSFVWRTNNNWALKGCGGSLKLVHTSYVLQSATQSATNEVVVWELEQQSGSGLRWDIVLPLSCIAMSSFRPFHNTDKSGWWLWAENELCYSEQPCDMLMFDDKGVVGHSIPVSDFLSFLDIHSLADVGVQGVWPLETSHLWEGLAFS